jgi:hypothetical protein
MNQPLHRLYGHHDPATLPPAFPRPADIARELVTLLRGHGLDQLYWSACALLVVLSVAPGLTVWTDGSHLTWTRHGTITTLPADDTIAAASHLAHLATQPAPPRGNTQ